jgi:hypothetical protein
MSRFLRRSCQHGSSSLRGSLGPSFEATLERISDGDRRKADLLLFDEHWRFNSNCNAMLSIGLLINASESELYIPQWLQIPVNILQAHHPSIQLTLAPNGGPLCVGYAMPNHNHIPLTWVGLKVLGCPLGTSEFCSTHSNKVIANICDDCCLDFLPCTRAQSLPSIAAMPAFPTCSMQSH